MSRLNQLKLGQNAYAFAFDPALLEDIRHSWQEHVTAALQGEERSRLLAGGTPIWEPCAGSQGRYHIVSFKAYPLLWISCANQDCHAMFRRFLEACDIIEELRCLVDHDRDLVMYSGFLVVSDRSNAASWHSDYEPGANAYTLITPLFELDPRHGHLLYRGDKPRIGRYRYQLGEAIVFGEGFVHSTQTFPQCRTIRVLLSLTVGTDKMQHWPQLRKTVGSQSALMRLPSGEWHLPAIQRPSD